MKVVVATRNRGKLTEILDLFERFGLRLQLLSIDDIARDIELREDGDTFEENALAKARQAARATGLPALADDSGLEVDALGGAPGVWSARYAGLPSDDQRNNDKLLAALAAVPPDARAARFRCVAAFVDLTKPLEILRAGACEGEILAAPRGENGFGYDPLFHLPHLGRSMAELDLPEKNRLSHRGSAFTALALELSSLAARGLLPGFPAP